MKKTYFYSTIFSTILIIFSLLGLDKYKVLGQFDFTNSSSSSGCPQIATDCFGEPAGCKSKFGIYDPEICKCVCPDSSSSSGEFVCEAVGSSCSCSTVCRKYIKGEPLIDCARFCSEGEIDPYQPLCEFVGSECVDVNKISCTLDVNCPKGTCSNGKTFDRFTCLENKCHQINYFADPCQFLSSSGTSSPLALNKKFTGIWKGKILKSKPSQNIILKLCLKGNKLEGTIHLIDVIENGSIISQEIISQEEATIEVQDKNNNIEKLNLKLTSTKGRILEGIFLEGGTSFKAKKISSFLSCKPFSCINQCGSFCCKEGESCLRSECSDPERCSPFFLGCGLASSSSGNINCPIHCGPEKCCKEFQKCVVDDPCMGDPACTSVVAFNCEPSDCSSRGSCRGENGAELPCSEGTTCSGLPAYGCYPPGCPVPICLSADTKIKTNAEQKRIADINVGDIVLTDKNKLVKVIKVAKTEIKKHKILKVELNDATILEVSPNHPTADGRLFKDLKIGDIIDGRIVVESKLITYQYKYTYDILPDSESGNYYANGVLVGSTLKK